MPEAEIGCTDEKYIVFSILDRLYTIPAAFIGEVAMFDKVYPLPLMPPFVLGIINRYSVPHALFDIGLMLFGSRSSEGKILVLKDSIDRAAFLVDDVKDIAQVPKEKLIRTARESEQDGERTDAVSASFEWNGSEVLVLDVPYILLRAADGAA